MQEYKDQLSSFTAAICRPPLGAIFGSGATRCFFLFPSFLLPFSLCSSLARLLRQCLYKHSLLHTFRAPQETTLWLHLFHSCYDQWHSDCCKLQHRSSNYTTFLFTPAASEIRLERELAKRIKRKNPDISNSVQ